MVVALLAFGGSAWAAGGAAAGGAAGVSASVAAAGPHSSQNTVPPTPAPATAGLPSPTSSPSLPSSQGLPASTVNELRPSPSLNTTQVEGVQATLAAGGLYRGPVDGNMSATLRASVREFQQISALPQTGELDAETMSRLTRSNATAGSSGSNGTTSTSGNLSASQPFSTTVPTVPGSPATSPAGTATFSTPFQLSSPINTSPAAAAGTTVQP
ncbi:MAG: peptidoglycan-binding protein [Myxococcales bacterium]|nr:peptidoglycan-binding protein [Myxococcales bacterium]